MRSFVRSGRVLALVAPPGSVLASVLAPALVAAFAPALVTGCSSSSKGSTTPVLHDAATADVTTPADAAKRPPDAGKAPRVDSGGPPAVDSGRPGDAAVDGYVVPASWNQTYTQPSDTAAAASRQACAFKRGDMPAQTTGPSTLLGSQIPIEHIVVLMQENRSFDSYFGHLAAYEATQGITNTIESAPAGASNPSFPAEQTDGGPGQGDAGAHAWQHAAQLCFADTAHSWGAAHIEYDHGLNDGFYYANNANVDGTPSGVAPSQLTGDRAMWYYDQSDLPFYYSLYSTFAMADHYHSALLGSTYPNRMYLYSGTSFGLTGNTFPDISAYPTAETPVIIFDELLVRGVTFNWYTDMGAPAEDIVVFTSQGGLIERYGRNPILPYQQFLSDAKAGTLPQVSFIDGDNVNETTTGNDEHPPDEIEEGQQFVWQIVNAVLTSPTWSTTALFLTYDENGGIYDHVPPPPACEPDNLQPVLATPLDQSQPGAFDTYGFRVPFVVISPYAKKSYVSHTRYSHTSILRFIESKFTLPALTARDANEDPFTDLFDWQNPPFMTPPTFPEPSVNQSAVTKCTSELGGG